MINNTLKMFSIKKYKVKIFWGLFLLVQISYLCACKKEKVIADNPYGDKVQPLIKFLNQSPYPTSGIAGTKVTFYVSGLAGKDTSDFQFFMNQERAQVISIKDSAITVVVPDLASSGAASILINGENYFGPVFNVDGRVSIDETFDAGIGVGSDGIIEDIYQSSDSFYIVGNFADYNRNVTSTSPINNIAVISKTGKYINLANRGLGPSGAINTILNVGGQYYIGGIFSQYDTIAHINAITKIFAKTGMLDTAKRSVINPDPDGNPSADSLISPRFNGGINGGNLNRLFYDSTNDKIVAIGNFNQYISYYYPRSTATALVTDRFNIANFVRMSLNGDLDSSYNINAATKTGYEPLNGYVYDAIQLSNGKIIIGGDFTKVNSIAAGRIAQLGNDGKIDQTFNAGGSGADGDIYKMSYNANKHQITIVGNFKNYNGVDAPGVAILNEDGTIDQTFHLGKLTGGTPQFATQLSNGMVLVTGTFTNYNNVYRQGMIFLNADGSLAMGYNNMGAFVGTIYKALEVSSDLGSIGLILVGQISLVDNKQQYGILKLAIQ